MVPMSSIKEARRLRGVYVRHESASEGALCLQRILRVAGLERRRHAARVLQLPWRGRRNEGRREEALAVARRTR